MSQVGGALTFIGSLIYLYVYYTWYTSGYAPSAWLSMTAFLAPFVLGVALFSAVTLFFMGIGSMSGMAAKDPKMMMDVLWKFIMAGAVTFVIITGGTGYYMWAVLALVLTYLGGMLGGM
jgi:hypothetical protein